MALEPVPSEGTSPSADTASTPTGTTLRAIVGRQLERHARHGHTGPAISVLGVCGSKTQVVRHGFERPTEVVLGLTLPACYGAVIAIAASVVSRSSAPLNDAHVAIAVDRSGDELCLLAADDGINETFHPQGWLVDACRRSLGLPTQPESALPLSFPLALWLDRLMVEIVHSHRPLSWQQAAARCPVPAQWRSTEPAVLGATLASTTPTWARQRRAAVSGGLLPVPITAAHAAWMDDAMFARWCLGFFPDLDELRADIEFMAPVDVAESVECTIASALATLTE